MGGAFGRRIAIGGRRTFSNTVRQGSSTGDWKAMPTLRFGPLTTRPDSSISPPVDFSSPRISFSKLLSAAARPDDGHEFLTDREIDPTQRYLFAIDQANVANDERVCSSSFPRE
jgi:hypothetical protein